MARFPGIPIEDTPSTSSRFEVTNDNSTSRFGASSINDTEGAPSSVKTTDKVSEDNTLVATPKFALPDTLRIGPFQTTIPLTPERAAILVGAGHQMLTVYRGVKQMMGIDEEEMKYEEKVMNSLYSDPEVGNYAVGGAVVGALTEPVGLVLPAAKIKSAAKAISVGVGTGATYGASSYVTEGSSRTGNAALGGTIGGTVVGVAKKFSSVKTNKAHKLIDNIEKEWASNIVDGKTADEATKALRQLDNNLSKKLIKATRVTGRKPKLTMSKKEAAEVLKFYNGTTKQFDVSIGRGVETIAGIMSTRIRNLSENVLGRTRKYEMDVLGNTHKNLTRVDDFLARYKKGLSKENKLLADKALFNSDIKALDRIFRSSKDTKLVESYNEVKKVLNGLGDELYSNSRISNKIENYFPRYVKDLDGLKKQLGSKTNSTIEEALQKARDSASKRGYPLTPIEESEVVNKVLRGYSPNITVSKAGFSKRRAITEVDDNLIPFYASPEESLHSYIRNAVIDIEKSKFFGKDLKFKKAGNINIVDVDESIGGLVAREFEKGKISPAEVSELTALLKTRFGIGEKGTAGLIQDYKNIMYASLLGNPISAATQLGDLGVSMYVNGFRNTLRSTVGTITGKSKVKMDDFGLVDNLAEEFATTRKSAKFLRGAFKYGGFSTIDRIGKESVLNGALLKYRKLSKSPKGIETIAKKYQKVFGEDFDKVLGDLKGGKITEDVKFLLFNELSDLQPITKLEVPEAYLKMPNGKIIYMLKTFMLKQIDLIRRDGYQEIKNGNVAKGMKNLMTYGLVVGSANVGSQKVKDAMLGKDVESDMPYDIGVNLLKTFGWSEYVGNKAKEGKIGEAAMDIVVPPFEIFDAVFKGDPRALELFPVAGKLLYYWLGGGIEKFEEKQFKKKYQEVNEPIKTLQEEIKSRVK